MISLLAALVAGGCSGGTKTETTGGAGGGGASGGGGAGGSGGASGNDGGTVDVGAVVEPGDPGSADVTFDVRADQDAHAISPLVYGWNAGDNLATNGQTIVRSGGNRMTAYNWENNDSNAGSDYFFENDGFLSSSMVPGAAIQPLLQSVHDAGIAALITVPLVDYVSADRLGGGQASGDVRTSANYLTTRFKQSKPLKGAPFTTAPDPSDGFVYQDEFVSWTKGAVPGTHVIFSLDNEPDLWNGTHNEVHPMPVTYDELVQRDTDYANAIKGVWPEAEVTGPVSWGWGGYVSLAGATVDTGKGDFLNYYLDHMKTAETAAGRRLVDYLDIHWYSEVTTTTNDPTTGKPVRVTDDSVFPDIIPLRLQAPRSLWDPTYMEASWITACCYKMPIQLIPLMKGKIAAHYPGTKLAITEWNYGAGGHISGGLAAADALGIFGREGVSMACLWPPGGDGSFNYAALRIYRNYDGQGATFGDTSIHAATSDVVSSSVYASIDAADTGRLVIVAINKENAPRTAAVRVAHPSHFSTAAVYVLSAAGGATIAPAAPISAAATNAFLYTMPAWSVSVLVPQ